MKCPSCGAEIESAKFCEYCGSQITAEMQKEQEQLNKKGCPKCGSSNIAFKRENQGEIRSKKAKKIIHKTVGYCKDCGCEWFPNELNKSGKSRKTWLWVLGWIFIFPVPLTILLLRKKDMNKILKYAIIAIAWIVYLAIGLSGGGKDSETTKPTDSSVGTAITSLEEKETEISEKINVTLDIQPNINSEDGSVLFGITTNLPEDTKLIVTVKNDKYMAQDTATILNNGTGFTAEFSDNGKALKGTYTVTVSMSLPKFQSEAVQKIVGRNGENIMGKHVKYDEDFSANYISGDFEFTF